MMQEFVLRGGTLVFPDRAPEPGDIHVKEEQIAAVLRPGGPAPPGIPEQSAKGLHVFPGLIDAHVHFGFGEKITEYSTETVYAAQGGFTTILAYFLNNEAYADVYRREQEHAKTRARTSITDSTSPRRTSCTSGSSRATSGTTASRLSSTS